MTRRPSRRQFLRAVSIGGTSAIAGCTGFIGDGPEIPERSANAPPLKWIADVHRSPWTTPTKYGQTIYCGSSFRVSALNASDGNERWHYEIDTPNDVVCYTGNLGVADGIVYTVGCHQVHAINRDGEKVWAIDFDNNDHGSTVPAISETNLYFGGNTLVQRDRETGVSNWKANVSGSASAPILSGEYAFVGTSTGAIQGIERTSGEVGWAMETDLDRATVPVVYDGIIFFGSLDSWDKRNRTGYLYAADIDEERLLWRTEVGPLTHTQYPAADNDTVFVTTTEGTLYAIAMSDGTIRWTFDTANGKSTPPYVDGNFVYVADRKAVYAIDILSGVQRWHIIWNDTLIPTSSSPLLVTNNQLYIGTYETRGFYAFDLS